MRVRIGHLTVLVHPLALLLLAEFTLSGSLQVIHHSQNTLSACTYPNPKSGTYLLMLCLWAKPQKHRGVRLKNKLGM